MNEYELDSENIKIKLRINKSSSLKFSAKILNDLNQFPISMKILSIKIIYLK